MQFILSNERTKPIEQSEHVNSVSQVRQLATIGHATYKTLLLLVDVSVSVGRGETIELQTG